MERTRFFRRPVVWIILVIIGVIALSSFFTSGPSYQRVDYFTATQRLNQPGIEKVVLKDKEQTLQIDLAQPQRFSGKTTDRIETQYPADFTNQVWTQVQQAKAAGRITGETDTTVSGDNILFSLLINLLPIAILVVLLLLFMSQMQGGGSRVLNFGKSKAKMITKDTPKTTFADVAGAEEAVQELHEIKDFLQNPAKYQALGAKIPKGVLLFGPPGTGKTLLARGVAGEAGVPFYSISGSDFVEMFVGVGASRVRDLFVQGKKNAPCIIFIDEIDAVGRHRGAGLGGGHDEREQTLNQLLVEMDGFETNEGVILIAATNRPDVLDPALLRPGRFDRRVVVPRPDIKGREGILQVHTRKVPVGTDVDIGVLARSTPGFAGADLENLVNEAALLAARNDKEKVDMLDLELAKDKVMMGAERRSMIISDEEKRNTAYHEAGHALVATLLPGADPIHKVTIIPRGMALGLTQQLPVDEMHNYPREYLLNNLVILDR